jgi:3D (Asp-Asp-Asp) domain-containing protein
MSSHANSTDQMEHSESTGTNESPGKKRKMTPESESAAISDEEEDAMPGMNANKHHIASHSSNASTSSASPSVISSATSGVIASYSSGVHSDINFKIVVNDGTYLSRVYAASPVACQV